MAPRPSNSGISRSISTTSGAWVRTFRSASMPSRAVAITRNSPDPSTTSVSSRRKNGLSSTTSTRAKSEVLDAMRHRTDFDPTITHPEPNGPSEVAAHCFSNQWNSVGAECLPGCDQVAFAHVHCSRRSQGSKHAGPAGQPRRDTVAPSSVRSHQLEHARHRGLGKSRRVAIHPRERGRRQQNMGQSTNASLGIVEHYCHTAPQAHCDQHVLGDTDPKVCNAYHQLPAAHAARR